MSKQFAEGPKTSVFHVDPMVVLVVGHDTPHKAGEHVLYDDRVHEEIDRSFIDGIKTVGVMEPVLVRKMGDDLEVVFGRKRTMALRVANEELVKEGKEPHKLPILPEERGVSDLDLFQKVILENEGRRDTSPMQKASRLKEWFDRKAATGTEGSDNEAAVFFNTTSTTVRNWKKLWNLDTKVQKAILQGKISANAAADLSDLEPEKQVEKLRELQAGAKTGKKISTAQTEGERRTRKGSVAATAYTAPSMSKVRKIAENEEMIAKLPSVVVSVIKFLSGLSDGADLPELKELVEFVPARGKAVKTGPKISSAQEAVLEIIDAAEGGKVLLSELKKAPVGGLLKLGMIDRLEGEDGLFYVSRGTGQASPMPEEPKATKKGKKEASEPVDPAKVKIPSTEKLETMPAKDLSKLYSDLDLGTPIKGRGGAEKMVKQILALKKDRIEAAKAAKAAKETKEEKEGELPPEPGFVASSEENVAQA